MRQILLDTNFLIHCVQQKIDFFEYVKLNGFEVLIPEEGLVELEKLANSKKINVEKAARLVQKLISKHKFNLVRINSVYVDRGIISYLKDKPEIILATLDRDLQNKVKNTILIIREKIKLELFNR